MYDKGIEQYNTTKEGKQKRNIGLKKKYLLQRPTIIQTCSINNTNIKIEEVYKKVMIQLRGAFKIKKRRNLGKSSQQGAVCH